MSKLARKVLILAKIESAYGTDPTPSVAANAILAIDPKLTPLEVIAQERKVVQHYLGNRQAIVAGQTVMLEFDVEIAGAGTAGNAPAYGPLLRGCAFGETLSAGTSAIYKPVSASMESLTLYFNVDGRQHALLGARGSVVFKFNSMNVPVMSFKFTGLYTIPTDTAIAAPTLTGFIQPLAVNNANSSAFSVHGYAAILQSLEVDMANQVAYRNLVGSESVQITDRQPSGTVVIESVSVATFDAWTKVKNATLSTATLTHGTAAGNTVKMDLASVQLEKPSLSEQDGVEMLSLGLSVDPSSTGNNEVSITIT